MDILNFPFISKECSNLIVSVNFGFGFYHFSHGLCKVLSFQIINVDLTEISINKLVLAIKEFILKETIEPVVFLNTPNN